MNEATALLARLGVETRSHQAGADEDRLAVMDVKTLPAYREVLARTYGFESAVERTLARVDGLDSGLLRGLSRARLLQADLITLGTTAAELEVLRLASTFRVRSAAHAFGWMFVLERQSLVSGLICRHVERTFGEAVAGAVSYYAVYGAKPGMRFRMFGEELWRAFKPSSWLAIVAGANDAFRAQRLWYADEHRQVGKRADPGPPAPLSLASR